MFSALVVENSRLIVECSFDILDSKYEQSMHISVWYHGMIIQHGSVIGCIGNATQDEILIKKLYR